MKYLIRHTLTLFILLPGIYSLAVASGDTYGDFINDSRVIKVYKKCTDQPNPADCLKTGLLANGVYEAVVAEFFSAKAVGKDGELESKGGITNISGKYVDDRKKQQREDLAKRRKNSKEIIEDDTEDPAIKKLNAFYENKLIESLYGKVEAERRKKGGAGANVSKTGTDHLVFYRLAKNTMSKGMIMAISSYCLEADPLTNKISKYAKKSLTMGESKPMGRTKQREANIKKLKLAGEDEKGKVTSAAYLTWGSCLKKLPKICQSTNDSDKYTKGRACEVLAHIRGLRQSLTAVETTEKAFVELGTTVGVGGYKIYHGARDKSNDVGSIDDLTSTSSGDLKASGYTKAKADQAKMIKECATTNDTSRCSEFLQTAEDKENLEAKLVAMEFEKNSIVGIAGTIEDEELRDFLLEEGKSQEEIERVLASDPAKSEVASQIEAQFTSEKQAIIDSIRAQNKTKLSVEGIADGSVNAASRLDTISSELAQNAEDYTQLLHFNNIVSGFLSVVDGEGKTIGSNSESINREIASMREGAEDQEKASALENALAEFGQKSDEKKTQAGDSTPIGTKVINDALFNYGADDKLKEKAK